MSANQKNPFIQFREEPKGITIYNILNGMYVNDIILASDRISLVHSMDRQNMMNSVAYIHHFG